MTKSGITRRIDELGRIVVPKEIRNNLGIRDGEPLEIYIENNSIIIKKYSQVENIKDISKIICDIISDICKVDILITDREKVIVNSNNLNMINIELDKFLKSLIDNRETYISNGEDNYLNIKKYFTIVPIITSTDCSGLVIILSKSKNEENLTYAKLAQKLIVQKLDVA